MTQNVSDTLNMAADLIEERGWATARTAGTDLPGAWGRNGSSTPLCLEGGIMAAAGIPYPTGLPRCAAYRAVWNYLQDDSRWYVFRDRLYDWNDAPDRTVDEVVKVLRATALIESARERQAAEVSA